MARRGRRSQRITYDSKETNTIIGLLSLLTCIIFLIATFVDTGGNNFFSEIRLFFGQTTLFPALFCISLGFYMLDVEFTTANRLSLLSQFLLIFLVPALSTSLYASKFDAYAATSAGLAGGQIGYFLAYNFFADTLVFAQYTPLLLGMLVLIFLPVAFSVSVNRLVEIIGRILNWIWVAINKLFSYRETVQKKLVVPDVATHLSDFNRAITARKTDDKDKSDDKDSQNEVRKTSGDREEPKVKFSEVDQNQAGVGQNQLRYPGWQLPPSSLLSPFKISTSRDANVDRDARIIEQTLSSFGVDAHVIESHIGPSIVRFAIDIPLGVKVSKVQSVSENIALGLGVSSNQVRIENIPGTTYIGIEVPREKREMVRIREMIESPDMHDAKKLLPVTVGKDISGKQIISDIQRMPHLLIAGATGSGKSVLTNSFIVSLLMTKTPDEVKLILVDPKRVELSDYNGIPHLILPVITDMDKVVNALKWAVGEMDRRYTVLQSVQVRNIEGYNEKMGFAAMPYIVIVIDEMADMMMTSSRVETETAIVRLTQKARAVGIHLILATQRPSVNVITGLIKANVPARIGLNVASAIDSRVILDSNGSETLMNRGDLLFSFPGQHMLRLQAPNVTQEEVIRVVDFIKSQVDEVEYNMSILEPAASSVAGGSANGDVALDETFAEAVRIVVNYQKGSASFLQRKLNLGFNRAARYLEEMEELGIVGPAQGSKPRDVLINDADAFLSQLKENK